MKEPTNPLIYRAFAIASLLAISMLLSLVAGTSNALPSKADVADRSRNSIAKGDVAIMAFDDAAWTNRTPASTAAWVTWVATVTKVTTPTPTSTPARTLPMPPSLLLARLAARKPSIWGSRSFYILLGLAYVTLLGLFLKQVIKTLGRK